jgi:integrase
MPKKRGNGEGTIVKRSDGRWMASLTLGRDPQTGVLKRASFYGKTRAEVALRLAQALRDQAHGVFVAPHALTVQSWLSTWLTTYKQPALRPLSVERYGRLIRKHLTPVLGHLPLRELRPEHLQQFYTAQLARGMAPRTVRQLHTLLHGALAQAEKTGLVARNVSRLTTPPRARVQERPTLSVTQMTQAVLPHLTGERLGVVIVLACGTGLRRGELLGLRWQDVDLSQALLQVRQALARLHAPQAGKKTQLVMQAPKTAQSRRTIPLPAVCVQTLRQHRARQAEKKLTLGPAYRDQGLVFCQEDGTPLNPAAVNRCFTRALRRAGLPHLRLHNLRHTFATWMLELGESPKTVQTLLGHSTVATTLDLYSHVSLELEKQAVTRLNAALTGGN